MICSHTWFYCLFPTIDTIHCVEQQVAPFKEPLNKEPGMNNPETSNEIRMDAAASGDPDATRSTQFVGSTQVLTTAGPLPLSFEIEGESLAEAAANFGDAAKAAFEKTMEELKEMQRQQRQYKDTLIL